MESTFAGKTVLVTGANRGLGQALVEEALRRGAKRVYGGARQPFSHPDARVVPVVLDVTDETQIQRAVGDDIFPDPMSATLAESWRIGAVK